MKKVKTLFIIFAILAIQIFNLPIIKESKVSAAGKVAIFYSPHADDETLSMGMAIAEHVAAGFDVHVVLMSYGENTTAVDIINGDQWCGIHQKTHNPSSEGFSRFGKNSRTLGQARAQEFTNACRALGVPAKNIHTEDAVWITSGQEHPLYSQTAVQNVMLKYERLYPGAAHKTTSYYDGYIDKTGRECPTPEHQLCGRALQYLAQHKMISDTDPRFYLTPLLWKYHDQLGYDDYNSKYVGTVQTALRQYGTWDPSRGSYAIGFHSVVDDFNIVFNHTASRYHTLKD